MLAALNSIEMVTVPWWFLEASGAQDNEPVRLVSKSTSVSSRPFLPSKVAGEAIVSNRRGPADGEMFCVRPEVRSTSSDQAGPTRALCGQVTGCRAFGEAHADRIGTFPRVGLM